MLPARFACHDCRFIRKASKLARTCVLDSQAETVLSSARVLLLKATDLSLRATVDDNNGRGSEGCLGLGVREKGVGTSLSGNEQIHEEA